jgi:hypothetical protein
LELVIFEDLVKKILLSNNKIFKSLKIKITMIISSEFKKMENKKILLSNTKIKSIKLLIVEIME